MNYALFSSRCFDTRGKSLTFDMLISAWLSQEMKNFSKVTKFWFGGNEKKSQECSSARLFEVVAKPRSYQIYFTVFILVVKPKFMASFQILSTWLSQSNHWICSDLTVDADSTNANWHLVQWKFWVKIFPDAFHWFLITKCGSSVSCGLSVEPNANHVLSTKCVHSDRMHSDRRFWPKPGTTRTGDATDLLNRSKKKLLTEAIFYIMCNSNEMFACFDFSVVVSCGKRPPIFYCKRSQWRTQTLS